ncbi:MAG TPA: hypothetical protein VF743_05835, partial [Acidimicrobiales bacterium]
MARATFTVGGSTAAAEPLVSDWSVTSYRFVPWGDDADNAVLPLRDATSCDDVRLPEGTVGGVSASPGSARVVATCRQDGAPGADVGAELAFPGLAHHTGDYAGSIDLAPGDDEAGAVALTVRRTDYVLVPLAVLLLGVGAALLAARQTGRIDALSADERDAWLLVARVDQAHRDFRAKAVDTSWAAYSFKADADERVRATMRELHRLGSGFSRLRTHDPDYASARAALEPVATAAAAWPLLADRLVELDVAITEVGLKASTHRPPTHASNEPACTAAARPLLAGRRLTVDDAVARAGAVDGAATLTGGWLEWAATVGQMESRAQLLALAVDELPEGHHDREALAEATAKVSAARVALWEVEDLAGLRERQVIEGIADARLLLDGLNHHFRDDLR